MQRINQLIGHYRTFISLILGLVILALAKPSVRSIEWGLPFILIGELVRTWSAGCINKEYEQLTTWGPYAYTRNPLYVGNFLLGLGFVMMGNQWILIALFVFLFLFVYRSTILDEENTLYKVFGETFIQYKTAVPRFIPLLTPSKNTHYTFTWKRVFKHREFNAWIGILTGILIMALKYKYGWNLN